MANTTLQKKDGAQQAKLMHLFSRIHTMKGVIFIILGAVIVMCLVLATGYFQP